LVLGAYPAQPVAVIASQSMKKTMAATRMAAK